MKVPHSLPQNPLLVRKLCFSSQKHKFLAISVGKTSLQIVVFLTLFFGIHITLIKLNPSSVAVGNLLHFSVTTPDTTQSSEDILPITLPLLSERMPASTIQYRLYVHKYFGVDVKCKNSFIHNRQLFRKLLYLGERDGKRKVPFNLTYCQCAK